MTYDPIKGNSADPTDDAPDFAPGGRGQSPRGGGCNTPPAKTNTLQMSPERRAWLTRQLSDPGLSDVGRAQYLRSLGCAPEIQDAGEVLGRARAARADAVAARAAGQQLPIDVAEVSDVDDGPVGMYLHKACYFFTAAEATAAAAHVPGEAGAPAALRWIRPPLRRACVEGRLLVESGACRSWRRRALQYLGRSGVRLPLAVFEAWFCASTPALCADLGVAFLGRCAASTARCAANPAAAGSARCRAQAAAGDPHLVAHGIDWLACSVYTELAGGVVGKLVKLREMERNSSTPIYVWGSHPADPARGRMWQVTWAKAPFALRLDHPSVASIRIQKGSGGDGPQCHLEIRAQALWQYGAVAILDELVAMLRGWQPPGTRAPRVTVSRIDLAADFVNLGLTGREQSEGRWIGRLNWRRRRSTAEDTTETKEARRARKARAREQAVAERASVDVVHGRSYNGSQFGARNAALMLAIYDKTKEIKDRGFAKAWQFPLWAAGGWDGESRVDRVELRLTGKALKTMIATGAEVTAIGTPDEDDARIFDAGATTVGSDWWAVRRALDAIWRYGVCRWLTLRDPVGPRPSRWPVSHLWTFVQAVQWGELADVINADSVTISRPRKRPRKTDAKGDGAPKRAALQLDLSGVATAAEAEGEIITQAALDAWGDGIATERKAVALRAAAADAGVDLAVTSAEARRKQMLPGLLGTLSAVIAADSVARGAPTEPVTIEEATARLIQLIQEGGADALASFQEKQQAALRRSAFTGLVRARSSLAHNKGRGKK